jgi:hypothetical protein
MELETWSPVKGYEGLYSISNYGKVLNHRTGKLQKQTLKKTGYLQVGLTGYDGKQRTERPHRLVALHFCNKGENANVVNHLDCNKTNNHSWNLEWTTVKGNTKHAYDNLPYMKKLQLKAAKLGAIKTSKTISVIKDGIPIGTFKGKKKCAEQLGISEKTIYNGLNNRFSNRQGYVFEEVVPVV